jgi:hypothetical protein
MAYTGNRALKGLQPLTNGVAGTAPRVREYTVAATYATSIGEGNAVIRSDTGINLATATLAVKSCYGVAAMSVAANTTIPAKQILVYDDPQQEYACVVDGDFTNAATLQKYIGYFVEVKSNTLNTTLGAGITQVDISSALKTASTTRPWQIMGIIPNVGDTLSGTDPSSTNAQVRIKCVDDFHVYGGQAGAVPGA